MVHKVLEDIESLYFIWIKNRSSYKSLYVGKIGAVFPFDELFVVNGSNVLLGRHV